MKLLALSLVFLWSCSNNNYMVNSLSVSQEQLLAQIPQHIVIAHRGTTFFAPEETEAGMIWARNNGAHYLEFDIQRTKDFYLVALHDDNLIRTSNVEEVFPHKKNLPVSEFTYAELLQLNFGKWFNELYPQRRDSVFEWQDILTLEDIVQIAEGKCIARDSNKRKMARSNETGKIETVYKTDVSDQKHRPGLYIETKKPELFPGIEKDLKKELIRLKWFEHFKNIEVYKDKIGIANSPQRIILQTFCKKSLILLHQEFGEHMPICFLLWRGNESADDLSDDQPEIFLKWVNFAIDNGATIIGPSIDGEPNNYPNLLTSENFKILEKSKLHIHPYSFDTQEQLSKYGNDIHGVFSNKANEALSFWK
jgi:glycerophosphoryl diester phosphodiesterase